MLKLIYTGIGSRETPKEILDLMYNIGQQLANGWVLRSGGAPGADTAFELGCISHSGFKEIYLPWNGFQGKRAKPSDGYILGNKPSEALAMAESFILHWHNCSDGARTLHSRNCYQILGGDLDAPTDLVICWTVGGQLKGGTATAMRMAMAHKIPIINLAMPGAVKALEEITAQIETTKE